MTPAVDILALRQLDGEAAAENDGMTGRARHLAPLPTI